MGPTDGPPNSTQHEPVAGPPQQLHLVVPLPSQAVHNACDGRRRAASAASAISSRQGGSSGDQASQGERSAYTASPAEGAGNELFGGYDLHTTPPQRPVPRDGSHPPSPGKWSLGGRVSPLWRGSSAVSGGGRLSPLWRGSSAVSEGRESAPRTPAHLRVSLEFGGFVGLHEDE